LKFAYSHTFIDEYAEKQITVLVLRDVNISSVRKLFLIRPDVEQSMPAEPEHFSSLVRLKAFINCADLTQFVSLGFQ